MAKVIHECSQTEIIARMHQILVGNGEPEDGLLFKQAQTQKDIGDIKSSIKEIDRTYKGILNEVSLTHASVITLKAELTGKEKAQDEQTKKRKTNLQTISVIIAFLGMIITMFIGFSSVSKKTVRLENQVDMINTPVRTRGGAIEFWPSGVVIDSLNKK